MTGAAMSTCFAPRGGRKRRADAVVSHPVRHPLPSRLGASRPDEAGLLRTGTRPPAPSGVDRGAPHASLWREAAVAAAVGSWDVRLARRASTKARGSGSDPMRADMPERCRRRCPAAALVAAAAASSPLTASRPAVMVLDPPMGAKGAPVAVPVPVAVAAAAGLRGRRGGPGRPPSPCATRRPGLRSGPPIRTSDAPSAFRPASAPPGGPAIRSGPGRRRMAASRALVGVLAGAVAHPGRRWAGRRRAGRPRGPRAGCPRWARARRPGWRSAAPRGRGRRARRPAARGAAGAARAGARVSSRAAVDRHGDAVEGDGRLGVGVGADRLEAPEGRLGRLPAPAWPTARSGPSESHPSRGEGGRRPAARRRRPVTAARHGVAAHVAGIATASRDTPSSSVPTPRARRPPMPWSRAGGAILPGPRSCPARDPARPERGDHAAAASSPMRRPRRGSGRAPRGRRAARGGAGRRAAASGPAAPPICAAGPARGWGARMRAAGRGAVGGGSGNGAGAQGMRPRRRRRGRPSAVKALRIKPGGCAPRGGGTPPRSGRLAMARARAAPQRRGSGEGRCAPGGRHLPRGAMAGSTGCLARDAWPGMLGPGAASGRTGPLCGTPPGPHGSDARGSAAPPGGRSGLGSPLDAGIAPKRPRVGPRPPRQAPLERVRVAAGGLRAGRGAAPEAPTALHGPFCEGAARSASSSRAARERQHPPPGRLARRAALGRARQSGHRRRVAIAAHCIPPAPARLRAAPMQSHTVVDAS